jgi:peroxiredoxin Q/BCP
LADYREHYEKIRRAGASIVAISVDPPDRAESVRRELHLPFPILCDTDRRVVREWNIYNSRERSGIAKPSVFLIDRDRTVRYASLDSIATRVPASEIVRLLESTAQAPTARRKIYIPTPADFFRVARSSLRRAGRQPQS